MKGGVSLLFFVLLLASCNTTTTSKAETENAKTQESYKPQKHVVEIKDMKFVPDDVKVHKGDIVVWLNKDIVAHDVTEDNKAWASSPIASEASWQKEFTESASYYCSIHVVMKGKVTVEE